MTFVAVALIATFALLASLHVYWAYGGARGVAAAVPVVNGKATLHPTRRATLVVAALLTVAGAVVTLRSRLLALDVIPATLVDVASWTIAVVFAARAVGDFKTVGFFKRVHGTAFSRWDTTLHSPLCLAIALACCALSLGRRADFGNVGEKGVQRDSGEQHRAGERGNGSAVPRNYRESGSPD